MINTSTRAHSKFDSHRLQPVANHQHYNGQNAKGIKSSTMKLASIWTYAFSTFAAAGSSRDPQDCAVVTGSYESIAYRYYAHSKNCATMSQVDDIEQVLHHKLGRLAADDIPSSDCVKFDEGGPLQGWVLFGRSGEVDLARYCGPGIGFEKGKSRSEL
jgi:hypothetical protein